MTRIRSINRTAISLLLALLAFATVADAGEVIDRIVAIVNGNIILQSDWNDALRYEALLDARSLSQFTDEERRAVLDRLIDQELLGEQMKSASFQHATEQDAATQVADARKLYPQASTDEGPHSAWNVRMPLEPSA